MPGEALASLVRAIETRRRRRFWLIVAAFVSLLLATPTLGSDVYQLWMWPLGAVVVSTFTLDHFVFERAMQRAGIAIGLSPTAVLVVLRRYKAWLRAVNRMDLGDEARIAVLTEAVAGRDPRVAGAPSL